MSLRRQLKKCCKYKSSVLHERLHYKDFDVNESIQENYYFFSYCIFISNFQYSKFNKSYAAFT